MTDFALGMTEIAFEMLFTVALLGLVFLTLYLPSLIITRRFLRRRKSPILRFLSYSIGPSIPERGADGSALRHALKRWSVLGLEAVLIAIASGFAFRRTGSRASWRRTRQCSQSLKCVVLWVKPRQMDARARLYGTLIRRRLSAGLT
jgi:hypothetical protein